MLVLLLVSMGLETVDSLLWLSLVMHGLVDADLLFVVDILFLFLLVMTIILLVILGRGTSIDLSNQFLVLLWQWDGSGQMVSDSAESVLISDVLDRVLLAVISLVGVVSLSHISLILLPLVLDLSVLDDLDSIGRLETKLVGGLGLLRLKLYNGDVLLFSLMVMVLVVGLGLGLICVVLLSLLFIVVLLVDGARSGHSDSHKGRQDDELRRRNWNWD